MEVNRDEAGRCRDIGATAMRQGNYPRAVKFLTKSLQLYPLPGVEALLQQAKDQQQQRSSNGNDNTTSNESDDNNATNNNNDNNDTTPTPSPPQRSASTASSTTGADGRAYTPDQVEVVQKVLTARQGGRGAHYRVLGLRDTCTEAEIKKAYRKLSLKVHPDKNSAPHADEAFKAVGLAYATLSDPQKRTIYDRYGDEDPDSRGGAGGMRPGGRGGGVHMHGQHVDPEEIFNMFFGGGMPGGPGGGGGVHFYSTGFGPGMHFRAGGPRARPRAGQQQQQQQQPENPGWTVLLQFLPIILMMLMSFSSYGSSGQNSAAHMPGVDRYFSLSHNPPFRNPMTTKYSKVKEIPYFVSDKFLKVYGRNPSQLGQVERMVERAYEQYLYDECSKQSNYKASLEKAARREKNPDKQQVQMRRAAEFDLSRCTELDDLFPERRKQNKQRYRAY